MCTGPCLEIYSLNLDIPHQLAATIPATIGEGENGQLNLSSSDRSGTFQSEATSGAASSSPRISETTKLPPWHTVAGLALVVEAINAPQVSTVITAPEEMKLFLGRALGDLRSTPSARLDSFSNQVLRCEFHTGRTMRGGRWFASAHWLTKN